MSLTAEPRLAAHFTKLYAVLEHHNAARKLAAVNVLCGHTRRRVATTPANTTHSDSTPRFINVEFYERSSDTYHKVLKFDAQS